MKEFDFENLAVDIEDDYSGVFYLKSIDKSVCRYELGPDGVIHLEFYRGYKGKSKLIGTYIVDHGLLKDEDLADFTVVN